MRTRLSPAATEDLAEILRTISAESPSGARGFREKFGKVRRLIGDFPLAGRQTDDPAVRYVNAGRYPYLIFFEVVDREPVILRILHGARDPHAFPAFPN